MPTKDQIRETYSFQKKAAEAGWDVGGLTAEAMGWQEGMLRELIEYVRLGKTAPDFEPMAPRDFKDLVLKELADFVQIERAYLPYFYAQMKSIEVSGDPNRPLNATLRWATPDEVEDS